jgi:hypothetical protein
VTAPAPHSRLRLVDLEPDASRAIWRAAKETADAIADLREAVSAAVVQVQPQWSRVVSSSSALRAAVQSARREAGTR